MRTSDLVCQDMNEGVGCGKTIYLVRGRISKTWIWAEISGAGGICTLRSAGILALELGGSQGRIRMGFHRPSILSIGGYEVDEDRFGTWSQRKRMSHVDLLVCMR